MHPAFRPLVIPCSISATRKELWRLNISARVTSAGGAHSASVRYVDEIAEIQRAVRTGTPVELAEVTIHGEAVP